MTRARATLLAMAVAAAVGPAARADTVLKGAAGTNAIPLTGVKVTGVAGGVLTYATAAGVTRSIPVADVQKLTIDGLTPFNAAEDAYAARTYPAALDAYAATLAAGGAPDWVRSRAGQRLSLVGRVQHRYDAQVAGYAALLGVDPAAAATVRPAAPRANDPTLDAAQAAVTRAIASTPNQRSALLGVQMDIARAKGDKAGFNQSLQQLVAAGGATPAEQGLVKLAAADVALDAKQYAQAETAIQQSRALFTDPGQQVDALSILAQARDGLLAANAGPDAVRDAALAHMRVVTFGSELPDRPHVAESLLRAAQLEEKLNEPTAALALYQQLTADRAYAATPAAADAATAVARLNKK